jgi:hypothetical protein
MFKGFAVSVALLLSVATVVSAVGIHQSQGFGQHAENGASLVGDGAAGNIGTFIVDLTQFGVDNVSHTTAYQNTAGALMQSAGVAGMGGVFNVDQDALMGGNQTQTPSLNLQDQNLGAVLGQDVTKIGGQGSALGLQTFLGVQTQLTFTPWGGSANVQGIGVSLYDAVGGGPGGGTQVTGGANFSAGQY